MKKFFPIFLLVVFLVGFAVLNTISYSNADGHNVVKAGGPDDPDPPPPPDTISPPPPPIGIVSFVNR